MPCFTLTDPLGAHEKCQIGLDSLALIPQGVTRMERDGETERGEGDTERGTVSGTNASCNWSTEPPGGLKHVASHVPLADQTHTCTPPPFPLINMYVYSTSCACFIDP